MRRPVPPHTAPLGTSPPRDLLEVPVEKTDTHWYWDGDFKQYDGDRFAVFRWHYTKTRSGLYVVVRALWSAEHSVDLKDRLLLLNTCGVVACVNPAHVERERKGRVFTIADDAKSLDGVAVHLYKANELVHIMPDDIDYAVCGWRLSRHTPRRAGEAITCEECVAMWRGRGHELLEVV